MIDPTNSKVVRIFDILTGNNSSIGLSQKQKGADQQSGAQIEHSTEIVEMELNQVEMSSERKMCFIDSNRDMFITMVHKPDVIKICNIVDSFQWNDANDMLACLSDGKLLTWFYPNAIYVDKDLMNKAMAVKDASDVGKLA